MKQNLAISSNFIGLLRIYELLISLILGKTGAIKTEITKDPRPQVKDVMMSKLRNGANKDDSDTDNDDW